MSIWPDKVALPADVGSNIGGDWVIFKPEPNIASIIVAVAGVSNVEIDEVLAITGALWVVEVSGF